MKSSRKRRSFCNKFELLWSPWRAETLSSCSCTRRKLSKELQYDERSKPAQRKSLKRRKLIFQDGKCAICGGALGRLKGALLAASRPLAENPEKALPTRLLEPASELERATAG